MFINDFENMFVEKGVKGIDVNMFELCLTLYADIIVLLANSIQDLQNSLDLLFGYYNKWKLRVNDVKTKIMIFKKVVDCLIIYWLNMEIKN